MYYVSDRKFLVIEQRSVEVAYYMMKFCEHYLRRFSVPRVLLCPTGIDSGCQVISGFGRHLGRTDTLGLDLMLVSTDDDRQNEFIVNFKSTRLWPCP